MKNSAVTSTFCLRNKARAFAVAAAALAGLLAQPSFALPLFARQTGQNCVACHAGGQFPELTPYGRLFKMTGYTIGERTIPLSAMGVITNSRVADTSKSDDPSADFQKNGQTIFATGSVFLGGKVTDNLGAFAQITYDPYATQSADGTFHGHTNADNIDLRYADRFIDLKRDLIVGISVNNNPSVSDPWNTAAGLDAVRAGPQPDEQPVHRRQRALSRAMRAGGNIAGITAYAFWNRTIYAELGAYGTSRGALSFMHAGLADADVTKLQGLNPYWRLAWNRDWGPHSLMIGTAGMTSPDLRRSARHVRSIHDSPTARSDHRLAVPVSAGPAFGDGAVRLLSAATTAFRISWPTSRSRLSTPFGQSAGQHQLGRTRRTFSGQADLRVPGAVTAAVSDSST